MITINIFYVLIYFGFMLAIEPKFFISNFTNTTIPVIT